MRTLKNSIDSKFKIAFEKVKQRVNRQLTKTTKSKLVQIKFKQSTYNELVRFAKDSGMGDNLSAFITSRILLWLKEQGEDIAKLQRRK